MPTITAAANNELELGVEEIKFIDALKALPDPRDNRGKRHLLAFLIVTVVFAILVGRSSVSGIHRYMTHNIDWLRETTGFKVCYTDFSCPFTENVGRSGLDEVKCCDYRLFW